MVARALAGRPPTEAVFMRVEGTLRKAWGIALVGIIAILIATTLWLMNISTDIVILWIFNPEILVIIGFLILALAVMVSGFEIITSTQKAMIALSLIIAGSVIAWIFSI